MPRRDDIHTILVIGSGPIIIGQAAEFDYSGTQALTALRGAGYRLVVVNSNSATIMTDPHLADATYVEPLTADVLTRIIRRERPDAILPTLGGQTALNLTVELVRSGVLAEEGVEVLGASLAAIERAEDRDRFKKTVTAIGLNVPESAQVTTIDAALQVANQLGYPVIVRPSFTLGGTGGGIAVDDSTLRQIAAAGLAASPEDSVLIEESVVGWKEYELEVMRDHADNAVVICSIENLDPMGVHTGDSITVAPAQTLTDVEYQRMRDAGIAVLRAIGVDTGGANIQFAVDPRSDRMVVIEMNPRVSRSSALASKATGYPIAKVAALLAVGYRLDEIANDITKETTAAFEPTLDYVVVKVPRLQPEKFPDADPVLGLQMKSIGEVMAIGRTFREALGKALRALELDATPAIDPERMRDHIARPTADRLAYLFAALRLGMSVREIGELSDIDPWFLDEFRAFIDQEERLEGRSIAELDARVLRGFKQAGFSDRELAERLGCREGDVRSRREALDVRPIYKMVDTCAGEFEASTPYFYSTYAPGETETAAPTRPCIVVLGSGPNRIGQGIEFDYANVHATWALREAGYDVVMVNSNPETVSTDHDISDRLYFEPLTAEDVLAIVEVEKPIGVLVGFGGQTPLRLAKILVDHGVPLLGTNLESIELAEDRLRFGTILDRLEIKLPPWRTVGSEAESIEAANSLGFPLLVRPSYVLGGRSMGIVHCLEDLKRYVGDAVRISPDHPVLLDRYLDRAVELDVDLVYDGSDVWIAGLMEQIEQAGVHSGDSASVLPAQTLSPEMIDQVERIVGALARALGTIGLLNVQLAIQEETVYVIEANPRASRTVPFVSKAIGIPVAQLAAKVLIGQRIRDLLKPYRPYRIRPGASQEMTTPCLPTPWPQRVSVKEVVLPFSRYPGADSLLGPEMRSTGEVMGLGDSFSEAFAKAQIAAGDPLPSQGTVLVSLAHQDQAEGVPLIAGLQSRGFRILATEGTAKALESVGVAATVVRKIGEGAPHVVDAIDAREVDWVINTPSSRSGGPPPKIGAHTVGRRIRAACIRQHVPYVTSMAALRAAVGAIDCLRENRMSLERIGEEVKS